MSVHAGIRGFRFEPFRVVPDFQRVESGGQFRDTVFEESYAENKSTHILIEGLAPVEEGSGVLTGTYRGVEIEGGSTHDLGQVLLVLPEGGSRLPTSSPIVGIVERDTPQGRWSRWSAYQNAPLQTSAIQVSHGFFDLDPMVDGTIRFSFDEGELTGSANHVVVDATTLEVAAFSLQRSAPSEVDDFAPMRLSKGSCNCTQRATAR